MDSKYEIFNFEGVAFETARFPDGIRLKTKQSETTTLEYKGFGKLMHWNDKRKIYQPQELTEQIVAFMNTVGGKIFLGIEDENHVLKGGDYTPKEKDMLSIFLKNLAKKLNVSGMGLIEDPVFIEYPKKYWIPTNIPEDASRYLVVIKVNKAPSVIKINGKILIRELGGVTQISEDVWRFRNYPKQTTINCQKPNVTPISMSYAQILKSR